MKAVERRRRAQPDRAVGGLDHAGTARHRPAFTYLARKFGVPPLTTPLRRWFSCLGRQWRPAQPKVPGRRPGPRELVIGSGPPAERVRFRQRATHKARWSSRVRGPSTSPPPVETPSLASAPLPLPEHVRGDPLGPRRRRAAACSDPAHRAQPSGSLATAASRPAGRIDRQRDPSPRRRRRAGRRRADRRR